MNDKFVLLGLLVGAQLVAAPGWSVQACKQERWLLQFSVSGAGRFVGAKGIMSVLCL